MFRGGVGGKPRLTQSVEKQENHWFVVRGIANSVLILATFYTQMHTLMQNTHRHTHVPTHTFAHGHAHVVWMVSHASGSVRTAWAKMHSATPKCRRLGWACRIYDSTQSSLQPFDLGVSSRTIQTGIFAMDIHNTQSTLRPGICSPSSPKASITFLDSCSKWP